MNEKLPTLLVVARFVLPVGVMLALTICPAPGQSKERLISAYSTDKSHSDPDRVFLQRNKGNCPVVVELRRGIGSAQVEVGSSWNRNINLDFRGFTRLEHFSVRSGERCIEGALGLPATSIGKWANGRCLCSRSKPGTDVLHIRVQGKSILLEIPLDFLRSSHTSKLSIDWVNEYR